MEIPGYKIEKVLGVGGMSTVYLAMQNSFGRKVALKVMDPAQFASPDITIRFAREAKIIASLSHPHIVPVYDVANHGTLHYMSMDYLDGGDLAQRIKRGLEIDEILRITENIASALHAAHSKGYIHRDIKPNNILFRSDGSPVLTDFGISRLVDANDDLTRSGAIVGTPRYMSPESLQGKSLDGRSDLYSLGVVFYEMLMKEVPYQAEDYMALGIKHITDPVPILPKHFARFQSFLNRIMAKNPDERFPSGADVVNAIHKLRTEPSLTASDIDTEARVGDFALQHDNIENKSGIRKVAAVPVKNIPTLDKRSRANPAPITRAKEKTEFSETLEKKLGFLKRYTFNCDITVYDTASFSMIFSSMTTRLLEWRKERGSQGIGFIVRLTSTATVIDLAKERINELYRSERPYDFVKKLNVALVIKNVDNNSGDIYLPDV